MAEQETDAFLSIDQQFLSSHYITFAQNGKNAYCSICKDSAGTSANWHQRVPAGAKVKLNNGSRAVGQLFKHIRQAHQDIIGNYHHNDYQGFHI
jgi:hypothetical protein